MLSKTLGSQEYVALRRRGTGWPDGRITKPVRARAIASELHVLRTMLLWATRVRQAEGSWLLRDYPLRGLKLPREEDVRRPIATHERFLKPREAIRTLAGTAHQKRGRERWVRIELALVLAEATGARVGAIRGLRWSDITYSPPRIRWRAEFDKKGRERLVPIPESLLQELRRFQAQLGGIGDGWLFLLRSLDEPRPGTDAADEG
jgi:integrase